MYLCNDMESKDMTSRAYVLTADGGSTKTAWRVAPVGNGGEGRVIHTAGMNPSLADEADLERSLRTELVPLLSADERTGIVAIDYYGAGCRGAGTEKMVRALQAVWPAARVTVGSDIVGAARALFGPEGSGIACILGTGSNSCLYLEGVVVRNVSPLGFILGDEASGAVLGRRLLGDVLKGQLSEPLTAAFYRETGLTLDGVIDRVYRQAAPNRFLASMVPFIVRHLDEVAVSALVRDEFDRFFRRNVMQYGRPDLPVGFVGGVAAALHDEVAAAAVRHGFTLGKIVKSPLG